mgnify:CR=1 FL=1
MKTSGWTNGDPCFFFFLQEAKSVVLDDLFILKNVFVNKVKDFSRNMPSRKFASLSLSFLFLSNKTY